MATPNNGNTEEISLKKIIVYYLRKWRWFVGAGIVSLILSIIYLCIVPTTYNFISRIIISDDQNPMAGMAEAAIAKSFGLGGMLGSSNVDDEMMVLNSHDVMQDVVKELKLNVRYEKPHAFKKDLYTDSPVRVTADEMTFNKLFDQLTFDIAVNSDRNIQVKMKSKRENKTMSFTQFPFTLETKNGLFSFEKTDKDWPIPFKLHIEVVPYSWTAQDLSDSKVTIEDVSKSSSVIELYVEDFNIERGKSILSEVVRQYNLHSVSREQKSANMLVQFLDSRLDSIRQQLNMTENSIKTYKNDNDFVDLESEAAVFAEQLSFFQQQLVEIQSKMTILDLLTSYLTNPANKYNMVPLNMAVEEKMSEVIVLYNEQALLRDKSLQNMKASNPMIKTLDSQLDKMRENPVATAMDAKKALWITKSELDKKTGGIISKMRSMPKYERDFVNIKRQQEIQQAIYIYLLQKREEVAMSMQQTKVKGKQIDEPYAEKKPVAPRKLFALIFMVGFTLIVPVGLLFLKEQFVDLKNYMKKQ